jgi:dipeptidyl aminopeptidase/acylaminoacyl peptidase
VITEPWHGSGSRRLRGASTRVRKRLSAICVCTLCGLPPVCVAGGNEPIAPSSFQGGDVPSEHHRSVTALDLARVRDISQDGFAVSPDGKSVAFHLYQSDPTTNRATCHVVVVSTDGGTAIDLGSVGDLVGSGGYSGQDIEGNVKSDSPIVWSPDSRSVLYAVKDRDGRQLWLSGVDGVWRKQLTKLAADVRDYEWSTAVPGRIFFTADRRTREDIERSHEIDANAGYVLDERFEKLTPPTVTPANPTEDTELWIHDIGENTSRRATFEEARERAMSEAVQRRHETAAFITHPVGPLPALFARGRDRRVAFAELAKSNHRREMNPTVTLAVRDVNSGRTFRARAPGATAYITDVWWSNDGTEVYFRTQDLALQSTVEILKWNFAKDKVYSILRTAEELSQCSLTARERLICWHSWPTHPGVVVSVDLHSGAMRQILDPNPQFRDIDFTRVERLEWSPPDGSRAIGYVVQPKDFDPRRQYPLVIVTFAPEGFLRGGRGNEYPVHLFAAEGMMVLVFQRSWEDEFTKGWGYSYARANRQRINRTLEYGIEMLVRRGNVDRTRIAVTGLSEGGEIAQWALTRGSIDYAAAILSSQNAAPFDYYFFNRDKREMLKKTYGVIFDARGPHGGVYDVMPVAPFVEHIHAPILFNLPDTEILGAMATVVPMQEGGKPCEVHVYPNEFHVKWQPIHRYNIYRRNVQWLKFWLEGREVADPVDPEQYVRWRALREMHRVDVENPDENLPSRVDVSGGDGHGN